MSAKCLYLKQSGYNGDFYHGCAEMVVNFCKNKGIEYHIKYGTQKKDNRKTEKIFAKTIPENFELKYTKQPTLSL